MFRFSVFLLFILFSLSLYPCAGAYQFKIFPVGMVGDNIVTIDVQMWRSDFCMDDMDSGRGAVEGGCWTLHSYISEYDKNQKLISSVKADSIQIRGFMYNHVLVLLHSKVFDRVVSENKNISLFTPEYISFCGYQQKCKVIGLNGKNLVYKQKKYPLEILDIKNKNYYGFNHNYFQASYGELADEDKELYDKLIEGFAISSVRRFSVNGKELLIVHLQRGHELGMGWITNNPNDPRLKNKGSDSDEFAILKQEETPNIPFKDIRSTTFEEPLLHHGYGFDAFIIR